MNRPIRTAALATLTLVLFGALSGAAFAKVVPAAIVLKVGDAADTSTVSTLNSPFTNGLGQVGFVAALADAQRMIWNNGPVFFSGDALPLVLTGGEGTMGISDTGGFIYSPSVDGGDAVYTHAGPLMVEGWPMPPLPGLYSTYNSRPSMLPNGTAYWCGGTATTSGGTTSNRHLFKATDPADTSTIVRVLGGGDVIEGKTLKTSATNFDYWISNNDLHHIQALDMNVTLNEHVYLDGAFVAQEGDSTGQGDHWAAFDIVGVNNDGNYIFTGDTDGATTSDEFVAVNGVIAVREGDTLDGVLIPSGATLRAASINNLNRIAHMWGATGEFLFFGDASDLSASRHLLSVGDSLDVDDDQIADYVVDDFNASTTIGPGLDLGDDGYVYLEADVVPLAGGTPIEAIVRVHTDYASAVFARGGSFQPLRLLAVGPNPSRHASTIEYMIGRDARVRIGVFDLQGREVRALFDGLRPSGLYRERWDGLDGLGRPVAAGAYFLRIESGGSRAAAKLIRTR